jgi:hypothetical protein
MIFFFTSLHSWCAIEKLKIKLEGCAIYVEEINVIFVFYLVEEDYYYEYFDDEECDHEGNNNNLTFFLIFQLHISYAMK